MTYRYFDRDLTKEELIEAIKKDQPERAMFDLIIANPPYGKSSSVSRKILNKIIESKIAEEMVWLSPRNTYKDAETLVHVDVYSDVENVFEGVAIDRLSVARIVLEKVNKFTYEGISLNEKQTTLLKSTRAYNSSHPAHLHVVDGNSIGKKWKLKLEDTNNQIALSSALKSVKDTTLEELVRSFRCFFKTIWTPSNGVHTTGGHDVEYNLNNKFDEAVKTGWFKSRGGDIFAFKSTEDRKHFVDWWYSCKETYGKERKGLTNYLLDMLCEAVSTSAGVNSFYDFFPHVDWSRSWTDEEIIAELKEKAGLPIDWEI